jgi:hypothetical protein
MVKKLRCGWSNNNRGDVTEKSVVAVTNGLDAAAGEETGGSPQKAQPVN